MVQDTLKWFERKLQQSGNLRPLESKVPVLHIILRHCFSRFVGFQESEGKTFTWWEQPVSLERTGSIRDQALGIVEWVIQHGSWLATLDALSAAAEAIRRVAPIDTGKVKNPAEFRKLWRPERLRALAVYERTVAAQNHVAVRYEIRATLLHNIVYEEEDAEFAGECRRVLSLISDDLSLRTTIAILSHGNFDFEHEGANPRTEEGRERARELWKNHVVAVANELSTEYPSGDALFAFLHQLGTDFLAADQHPFYEPLFAELVRQATANALALAKTILGHHGPTPLARAWVVLISDNSAVSNRSGLLHDSVSSKCDGIRAATVSALTRTPRNDRPLTPDEEAVLRAIAKDANADETHALLQFIEWAGPSNIEFAYFVLETMRLDEHAPLRVQPIFEALVPHEPRQTSMPSAIVEKTLAQLVRVPEIDTHNLNHEWDFLCEKYPKAVYGFVVRRIQWSLSGNAAKNFSPAPHGYRDTFDLPRLKDDPDFPQICDELWKRVEARDGKYQWLSVFQAVVLNERSVWVPRMLKAIAEADSIDGLSWLARLLGFDGSLIVFREPDVTRAFLQRANELAGLTGIKEVRSDLYSSCGPQTRGYTAGELDKEDDYVEAEAAKAAAAHQNDAVLAPFYQWIVEAEQRDKAWNRARIAAETAAEE